MLRVVQWGVLGAADLSVDGVAGGGGLLWRRALYEAVCGAPSPVMVLEQAVLRVADM
jgi:hypothetical protein